MRVHLTTKVSAPSRCSTTVCCFSQRIDYTQVRWLLILLVLGLLILELAVVHSTVRFLIEKRDLTHLPYIMVCFKAPAVRGNSCILNSAQQALDCLVHFVPDIKSVALLQAQHTYVQRRSNDGMSDMVNAYETAAEHSVAFGGVTDDMNTESGHSLTNITSHESFKSSHSDRKFKSLCRESHTHDCDDLRILLQHPLAFVGVTNLPLEDILAAADGLPSDFDHQVGFKTGELHLLQEGLALPDYCTAVPFRHIWITMTMLQDMGLLWGFLHVKQQFGTTWPMDMQKTVSTSAFLSFCATQLAGA